MRSRNQYPAEIMAQASLDVAGNPELGNSDLAHRAEEVIAAGADPFYLVSRALSGRVIMEKAEAIRLEQTNGKRPVSESTQTENT